MTATRNSDFAALLNEYCPNSMLFEELVKKDYYFNKMKKDLKAYGSKIPVPFMSAGATSVRYGKLTAANDIAQSKPVRGELETMTEVYASLIFNHADLVDQEGRIPEQTFLKVFPGEIERMTKYVRENMSMSMLNGAAIAKVTDSTNAATGIMIVNRPDRFQLDQKVEIKDDDSVSLAVYVISIAYDTKAVKFSATRGGAAVDLSAYTAAANAKLYNDGALANGSFNSLRSALLSAANGGTAALHGKTKLNYGSFLQAMNLSGSDITATNLIDKLFDKFVTCKMYGKCTGDTFLMNLKHMGSAMKIMESHRGDFVVVKNEKKPMFGWWETEIASTTTGQTLKMVGLQEHDEDVIPLVNFDGITLRSKGGLRKIKQPDGSEFYTQRTEDGYSYIVDLELHGQVEFSSPGENMIVHSINY